MLFLQLPVARERRALPWMSAFRMRKRFCAKCLESISTCEEIRLMKTRQKIELVFAASCPSCRAVSFKEETKGVNMGLDFSPQFHKRLSYREGHSIWVAAPYPKTLVPIKMRLYQAWRREEHARLQRAGADVMAIAISI
jgi:hypothetical protein